MNYEEYVKNKLWDMWQKDAVRTQNYSNGWKQKTINLGIGMVKRQGTTRIDEILETIEDFGIDMDLLDAMNPSYDQLNDIYIAIKTYRGSVRFLKELKNYMTTFKNFKNWKV